MWKYRIASLLAAIGLAIVSVACGGVDSGMHMDGMNPPVRTPANPVVDVDGPDTPATEDSFELGKRIFESEAGEGVGCSYCHGDDGLGNIGPNIRGKTPGDVRFALESIDAMSFINLNETEIVAVSEYLQWLATQPE